MRNRQNTYCVYPAEPYKSGNLGSFGKASYMFLRQYNFPNIYSEQDTLISADHDRCREWDMSHTTRCFVQHTGKEDSGFEKWVTHSAKDEEVITFLVDILKQNRDILWTGYRIMGTVNSVNGHPIWTLQLFAKNPKGKTEVYNGEKAPNVLMGPRM